MKALGALVLLLGLSVTACSAGDDANDASNRETPFVPSDSASASSPSGGATVDLASTEVCGLVRDGIDAFNTGDLEATIATFEQAIPLAEDLARENPSEEATTLLDAVRYYATIPAKDYVEESKSSTEFLKFKDFTLDKCAYGGPPAGATDPAIPA